MVPREVTKHKSSAALSRNLGTLKALLDLKNINRSSVDSFMHPKISQSPSSHRHQLQRRLASPHIGLTNRAWHPRPLKSTPVTAVIPPFLSLVNHEKIMIKHGFFKAPSKFKTFYQLKNMKPTFLY